jgi:hypothetical protein
LPWEHGGVTDNSDQATKRRRGPGRPWPKGFCPNPAGRPREVRALVEAAREHTREALDVVLLAMRKARHLSTRLRAAEIVLDRAWGRPAMSLSVDLAAARVDLAVVSAAEWEALSVLRHHVRPGLPAAEAVVEVETLPGEASGPASDGGTLPAEEGPR